jgi:hypothetical protein
MYIFRECADNLKKYKKIFYLPSASSKNRSEPSLKVSIKNFLNKAIRQQAKITRN